MSPIARRLVLIALAVVCLEAPARAQDDEDEAPLVVQQPTFTLTDQQFDSWAFGNQGNANAVHGQLDALLTAKVAEIGRSCPLTPAQTEKLRLAGRGDIKRFFDQVEDKRKRFQTGRYDQTRINELFQEIQPLQTVLTAGPFNDGSLFAKTLKTVLDDQQLAHYQTAQKEAIRFRYRAKIDLITTHTANNLGLSSKTRETLAKLLLEETRPPLRFGVYDQYVVLYQAARLPEAKLRPLFDDTQWRMFSRQLAQARSLEQFLIKSHWLPDDAVPGIRK
jgi:hypothetical protein